MAVNRRSLRRFDCTVDIETLQGTTAADSRGRSQLAFDSAETVQCSITPLAGRELSLAREIVPTASHRVEMYHTTTLTPKARLNYGGRIFNIDGTLNVDERGRYAELLCTEVVA